MLLREQGVQVFGGEAARTVVPGRVLVPQNMRCNHMLATCTAIFTIRAYLDHVITGVRTNVNQQVKFELQTRIERA